MGCNRTSRAVPTQTCSTSAADTAGGRAKAVMATVFSLALLVVGCILTSLSPSRPGTETMPAFWREREAAVQARLREDPRDDHARLDLAGLLMMKALARMEDTPLEAQPGGTSSEGDLTASSAASPALVEAWGLAAAVAEQGRNPRLRARGWLRLSLIEYHLGHPQASLDAKKAALREAPTFPGAIRSTGPATRTVHLGLK
jgi:hypothetical protein